MEAVGAAAVTRRSARLRGQHIEVDMRADPTPTRRAREKLQGHEGRERDRSPAAEVSRPLLPSPAVAEEEQPEIEQQPAPEQPNFDQLLERIRSQALEATLLQLPAAEEEEVGDEGFLYAPQEEFEGHSDISLLYIDRDGEDEEEDEEDDEDDDESDISTNDDYNDSDSDVEEIEQPPQRQRARINPIAIIDIDEEEKKKQGDDNYHQYIINSLRQEALSANRYAEEDEDDDDEDDEVELICVTSPSDEYRYNSILERSPDRRAVERACGLVN